MTFTSRRFEMECTVVDAGNNISKVRFGVTGADIDAAETRNRDDPGSR